jgi:hypothetical protein
MVVSSGSVQIEFLQGNNPMSFLMPLTNCSPLFTLNCRSCHLSTFTTDTSGELDVLWLKGEVKCEQGFLTRRDLSCLRNTYHDGHSFGVNSAQVGVLEERDEVSLRGFLESSNGSRLETKIGLVVLSDFSD